MRIHLAALLALSASIVVPACVGQPPPDSSGGGGGGGGSGGGGGGGSGGGLGSGSGSGSGSDSGGGGGTATAFLAGIASSDCTEAFTCMASFPATAGTTFADAFGASVADCESGYFDVASITAEIAAGKIQFDATAASACVSGITAAASCTAYWAGGNTYPAACDTAMVGTVADGGACVVDFDCSAAGSICDATTLKCGPDTQAAFAPGHGEGENLRALRTLIQIR